MREFSQFFIKNKLNFLLVTCWLLIVIPAIIHHEIWYDEIISYHVVKTLNFPELLHNLQISEGHPPLWYLLQYPFVKFGCSPVILKFLSFIFVFSSVCYLLFRSKFNILVKFLFLFSSCMLYLLPVISRNYALIPVFAFLLADLYPNRHKHPLIYSLLLLIISQIHILLWGFCIICTLLFLYEFLIDYLKDKSFIESYKAHSFSILILFSDFVLTLYFFRFFIFNHRSGEYAVNIYLFKEFFTFIPAELHIYGFIYYLFIISIITFILSLLFLNKKVFLIFISFFFSFEFILLVIYQMFGVPLQKICIFFIMIIFAYWLIQNYKGIFKYIADISLLVILSIFFFNPFSYNLIKDDINHNFCNLSILSDFFVNKLSNDEYILVVGLSMFFDAYLDYLPQNQILKLETKDLPPVLDNEYIENNIIRNINNLKYIIITKKIKYNIDDTYKLIYDSPENKVSGFMIFGPKEDNFVIYERK